MSFEKFSKDVEIANDKINLKKASKTERKGVAKLRDRLVFGKVSWGEAFTYLAIVQTTVIFFGLMDDVIINMNSFLSTIGIGYQFPVGMSVLAAFAFILFVIIFGILAVRHIGTYRSSLELGTKMNPGFYMLWKQNEILNDEIKKLKKKVDGKDGKSNNRNIRIHR